MDAVKASQVHDQKNLLENLWGGNLGLAMTYWVYGVLGGVVWAVGILALRPEPESDFAKIIYFMMTTYYVVVYVGIWKAANKFTGNNLWAILAKFVVVIVVLPFAIGLGYQQYKSGQDEQERKDRLEQAQRMKQVEEKWHNDALAAAIKIYPFKNYITVELKGAYDNSTKAHYLLIPKVEVRIFTKNSEKIIENIEQNRALIEEAIYENLGALDYKYYVGIDGEKYLAGNIKGTINSLVFGLGLPSNEFTGGVSEVFFPQSFSVRSK